MLAFHVFGSNIIGESDPLCNLFLQKVDSSGTATSVNKWWPIKVQSGLSISRDPEDYQGEIRKEMKIAVTIQLLRF
jgi:hypothetical protein